MEHERTVTRFSKGLLGLRDVFHKTGRLDDSNTKLDEITKILALEVAQVYHPDSGIPPLSDILSKSRKTPTHSILDDLNKYLQKASRLPIFLNDDGDSLFGPSPTFSLTSSDRHLAEKLVEFIVDALNGYLREGKTVDNFELLNEAFGHFVRDNFRNNIEDAQYMTPIEVVNYMCRIALQELEGVQRRSREPLVVADPSCGVGSFLAQFYRLSLKDKAISNREILLVGQDKVDRMTRLARLNLLLFGLKKVHISRGNSLVGDSSLSRFTNRCDLILTNPPFGARFHTSELRDSAGHYPLLSDLIGRTDTCQARGSWHRGTG